MQLLMSPASPFARKIRIAIRLLGLENAVEDVPVQASAVETPSAPLLAANPLGKIPVLVRPDGPALYDSRVIARYLNAYAGGDLYPEPRLWEVLTLEATAEGMMDAAVSMTYEARFRAPDMRSRDWLDGQWRKVSRGLATLETRWMSHLSGPRDMGHIGLICALEYLDFRHGERGWRSAHPALANWLADRAGLPGVAETRPVG